MRSESTVLEQILSFANEYECIRAVVMNGSRANPMANKDIFCDYDIACYTHTPKAFADDQRWIARFGELVILQQNDFVSHGADGTIFLMQFCDGVRIDLSFHPLANLPTIGEDSLTIVLLDKDGRSPALPAPTENSYYIAKPEQREYDTTVNEIFWCSTNVAKGIWRDELPYAKAMLEEVVRPCVLDLLIWYTSMQRGWKVNTGKFGRWLKRYLPQDIWEEYVQTYRGAGEEDLWEALFKICALTRLVGQELAQALNYQYPILDDQRTVEYLLRVRELPASAESFD